MKEWTLTINLALLCITIALLAVLASFHLGGSTHLTRRIEAPSPEQLTLNKMFQVARFCSNYRKLFGYWPTNAYDLGFVAAITNRSVLQDAWGRPFVLRTDFTGKALQIISYGKDGRFSGIGEDSDLTWTLDKPIP